MDLIEFIGFLLTMVLLFFLMGRKTWKEKYRKKPAEEFDLKEEERALREFLQSIDLEIPELPPEEEKLAPEPVPAVRKKKVPKRLVRDAYTLHTDLEDFKQHTRIEDRHIDVAITEESFDHMDEAVISGDLFLELEKGAYQIIEDEETSRAHQFVERLPDLRQMLISQEIFSLPKGLNPHCSPYE